MTRTKRRRDGNQLRGCFPNLRPLPVKPGALWRRWAVVCGVAAVGLADTRHAWTGPTADAHSPPASPPLPQQLRAVVDRLAGDIGERNWKHPHALGRAEEFLSATLTAQGWTVGRQEYTARGVAVNNLEVERPGTRDPGTIVLVGAHYDSVTGSPGANDNASGCAVLLALAAMYAPARSAPPPGPTTTAANPTTSAVTLASRPAADAPKVQAPARTLRVVFFVNEEPPFFQTPDMGSWHYARRCKARHETISAMLSLETIGYYSKAPGSQKFPSKLLARAYPTTGDFVAFIGTTRATGLTSDCLTRFRAASTFPAQRAALPGSMPGIGWSDHWSFEAHGYPALMVTDTAPFRYPHYHEPTDTPDKLDYESMAQVTTGLAKVLEGLLAAE